jgi:hypothetical protein
LLPHREEREEREGKVKETRKKIEQIAEVVVGAMVKVHRPLGPSLFESAYQACLAHELRKGGNKRTVNR